MVRPHRETSFAEVGGAPDAPGIVFVHGTRMAGAYWHAQLLALQDRFHVVAVDLPGHGSRRATPFSHPTALEVILVAIAQCAGGAAIVVGHSLGGYLVMDVAAEAPDRCRALVLVGCTATARGMKTLPFRLGAQLLPLLPEARLARWNDMLLRRLYPPELVEPQIAAGYGFAAIPPSWRAVLDRDHLAELSSYPGPVLILNGEHDILFRSGEQRFLRACRSPRLRVLAGASHLSSLDRPAEFNAAIREFAEAVYGLDPGAGGRSRAAGS
jgi:pimeloyl-ACP methyl ester carboxylesterase